MGQCKTEKIFEPIDLIEVAIKQGYDDDKVLTEIVETLKDMINPYLLFKIFVFYERVSLLESLKATVYMQQGTCLLSDTLQYAVAIDRMKVAFYLVRKYQNIAMIHKKYLFEQLLLTLQLYSDVDIREKGCGIMHLEEKLFLIELLLPYVDFLCCHQYISTIDILLNFSEDGEEVAPFGSMKYVEVQGKVS